MSADLLSLNNLTVKTISQSTNALVGTIPGRLETEANGLFTLLNKSESLQSDVIVTYFTSVNGP